MIDPIRELKIRAEVLHHRRQAAEPDLQRKDVLTEVARAAGFQSWTHALRVLEGDADEVDFGTLLYPAGWGARLNHWFAHHDEARAHREANGGYLLAYKRHFFVVERDFIAELGLDPDDADWAVLGFDWARPASLDARRRLYGTLLARQRPRA